ncbi:competence type IV pilus assembly protein ComGB [Ornithinibacillus caprae]|nr:competence type IV pilus assembly protein ComGB [Ornithinibacillus caprae]
MGLSQKIRITPFKKKTLKSDLQLRFLHRLERSLSSGYPLLDALETIKWDQSLVKEAEQMILMLKNGESIDKAFSRLGFHHSITSFLLFTRSSGNLSESLVKCKDMYQKRITYTKKFEQIIRYPIILLIIFSLLLFFLNRTILPSFENMFHTNPETNTSIHLSMEIIAFMNHFTLVIFALVVGTVIFWLHKKKSIPIEKRIIIYQSIPIYKSYLRMQTSFLFATHLSSLLKTGMSLKDIFNALENQENLPIISHYAKHVNKNLGTGVHLTNVIKQIPLLDKQLTIIFQKNTNTFNLEKDLSIYAELLLEEIHQKILKIFTYIQPIFFIILATFIIFIYLSLMWPMFQLMNTI